jgi:hypothetical protein
MWVLPTGWRGDAGLPFVRMLVCATVCLLAAGARADWVKASETAEARFFVDLDSAEREGSTRRLWELTDLKQRGKDGELSMRARVVYDCQGQRARTLSLTVHAEPMAAGKTVFVGGEDPRGWFAVAATSVYGDKLRLVCAR